LENKGDGRKRVPEQGRIGVVGIRRTRFVAKVKTFNQLIKKSGLPWEVPI